MKKKTFQPKSFVAQYEQRQVRLGEQVLPTP